MSSLFAFGRFVDALVQSGNLFDPCLPLGMLQGQDQFKWPVKVVRDIGYLLVEPVEGVANYPPSRPGSTSKRWSQLGQATSIRLVPVSLICR